MISPAQDRRASPIDLLDKAALVGSCACLAHCLALPLLIAALPALSSVLTLPESVHLWVLAFAAPAAALALVAGHARHRALGPLLVGVVGLSLLAAGALLLEEGRMETVVTVAGSLALASAHVANWRLRHRCLRPRIVSGDARSRSAGPR